MRRILLPLLAAIPAIAMPTTAHAAVLPTVSADTLTITGDAAADRVVLRLAPGAPGTLQVDAGADGLADFAFDRNSFSRISVRTGAGNDEIRLDESNGAFTDTEATTIESGAGADLVIGGRGPELIAAGDDADLVHAGAGDDTLFLGAGNDTAIQGADDGADTIEGQSGADTLQTSGSSESEEFTVQALAPRVRITRDVGSARVDMAGIELAEINAAGGPDLVDVGDLSGTELARVDADLGLADGAPDAVFAAGSPVQDNVLASALGDTVRVTGLPGEVRVENATPQDRLTIQAGGGDDDVRASGGPGAMLALALEGNAGRDVITGGTASEVLRGGPERDIIRGGPGADTIEAGDGDDHLIWGPATDGNDTIGGDAGEDTLRVPTTTADDHYDVAPIGARVRIFGGVNLLNLDTVETIDIGTGAGADKVTVRDLTGTPTKAVRLDVGAADLKVDTVAVEGTVGPDTIGAVANTDFHELTGLAARTFILGAEPGDRLEINASGGDDTIDASKMAKDKLQPFLQGSAGNDLIIGSPGQDQITGGSGNDIAFMGAGLDTFNWLPGDGNDIVEGQAGDDFLRMTGSGANERFELASLASRLRLARDVSNVLLDMNDVERLDINPAGGADTIVTRDLGGTDAKVVTWELAPFRGTTASDQAADSVLVDGTNGIDAINVTAAGQQVRVTGLAAAVEINRSDPALDTLHVDTKLGNDSVTVAPAVHQRLKFSSS